MARILTVSHLMSTDAQLKDNKEFSDLYQKYSKPASQDVVERTVKALTDKGHKAYVVENKDEFMKLIQSIVPDGASIYSGNSTTLAELGFIDFLIANPTKYVNHKAAWIEATKKGDDGAAAEAFAKGTHADYWFASAGAVAESGEIVWSSATGTRVAPYTPKNLVFVCGTNKITPNFDEAMKRLKTYHKMAADAETRAAFGVPAATEAEIGIIQSANPFNPGRIHVIFVKGSYGY